MGWDTQAGSTLRETVGKRADVLASIRTEPARKPALTERLAVSRSTVDRAIDSLVDGGLIDRVDGRYHITTHGELVLDAHQEYVSSTDALAEAAPILRALPPTATVPPSLIQEGVVRLAEPHSPETALMEPIQRLETADRLYVFSRVVKPSYLDLVHTEVMDSGLEVELVLGAQAVASLASLAGAIGTVEELVESDLCSLYETQQELPFTLYCAPDDRTEVAGIMTHRDGGLVGSVTSHADDALAWGRERYEEVAADAEPVPTGELL